MSGWDVNDLTLPEVPLTRQSGSARKLALTILFHPDFRRIGERAMLDKDLGDGLSRLQPGFTPVRDAHEARPLTDSYLSRSPVQLAWRSGELQIRAPSSGASLKVDGVTLRGTILLTQNALEAGVVLTMAHRVVLLLHCAPGREPAARQCGMVGEHDSVQRLRRAVEQVAGSETPVLLLGESGTGKELLARAIHDNSARARSPFIAVNMAAIPEELAAAELFGVRRGAYTGAEADRPGFFQRADGGTLFLDEIGACPAAVQAQLLRALQEGEVQRPGGGTEPVDVRVVAATDADPGDSLSTALRHRLSGFELLLPPLRERREDLGRLMRYFFTGVPPAREADPREISRWADLVTRMALYPWPGNIREFANACRQLSAGSGDTLNVPEQLHRQLEQVVEHVYSSPGRDQAEAPTDQSIREAMLAARWEVSRAARALDISRQALYRRIEAIPELRTAAEIPLREIESAYYDCKGDLQQAALRLQVSETALKRRWRALDLDAGRR